MENVIQDNSLPAQPIQQQSSNVTPTNSPSKSKLKIIIAIFVIIILLSIGGYVIAINNQSTSQNILSKGPNCGTDLDCFIKAAQSCSPATVSKTYALQGNVKNKMTYEIKGQESEKCVLITKVEIEGNSNNTITTKAVDVTGIPTEEIKQLNEAIAKQNAEIAKQKEAGITCGFDKNDLVSAIQDLKVGKNTLNEKISTCPMQTQQYQLQANNSKRQSDVNSILNAVNQYMADNKGPIPSVITTSEQEISKSKVDLCSTLFPGYLAALPIDPKLSSTPITDCKTSYSTGYTILKDAQNKITIKAPYAELGQKIEVIR